jgi:hypothetical protein
VALKGASRKLRKLRATHAACCVAYMLQDQSTHAVALPTLAVLGKRGVVATLQHMLNSNRCVNPIQKPRGGS